jgi:hypothetical protein
MSDTDRRLWLQKTLNSFVNALRAAPKYVV